MAVHLSYVLNVRQTAMQVNTITCLTSLLIMLDVVRDFAHMFINALNSPRIFLVYSVFTGGLLHVDQHLPHQHGAASVVAPLRVVPLHSAWHAPAGDDCFHRVPVSMGRAPSFLL